MNVKQAYERVCGFLKDRPMIASCRDYEGYFGFLVAPPNYRKGTPMFLGRLENMILVDKRNGKTFRMEDSNVNLHGKLWRPIDPKIFNIG